MLRYPVLPVQTGRKWYKFGTVFVPSCLLGWYCKITTTTNTTPAKTNGLLPDMQNCSLRMCRGCRERFPRRRQLAIPTCITARAWRTCRDACRDHWPAVYFEVGGGEKVPGIPGPCATRNFAYLLRGPWQRQQRKHHKIYAKCFMHKCNWVGIACGIVVLRYMLYKSRLDCRGPWLKSWRNDTQRLCWIINSLRPRVL